METNLTLIPPLLTDTDLRVDSSFLTLCLESLLVAQNNLILVKRLNSLRWLDTQKRLDSVSF
jgi:hypothetical protein